jgi:uncharacterized protein YlxW (UPF0749 family)
MSGLIGRIRRIPSWQVALFGALLVLGFLVVAQLRAEAPRVRYTSQERGPLLETATELRARQEGLKDRILALRTEISGVEENTVGADALVTALNRQLDEARGAAGLVELVGPGVALQLEDSTEPVPPGAPAGDYRVSATDLLRVVDELWKAGAEVVGVNGERITATSAFVDIGTSVLVNSAYLQPPYQVVAIGPPELYGRLMESLTFVDFVRARVRDVGIKLGVAQLEEAIVPAYAGSVRLVYAQPVASAPPSPGPSPSSRSTPRATSSPARAPSSPASASPASSQPPGTQP